MKKNFYTPEVDIIALTQSENIFTSGDFDPVEDTAREESPDW